MEEKASMSTQLDQLENLFSDSQKSQAETQTKLYSTENLLNEKTLELKNLQINHDIEA